MVKITRFAFANVFRAFQRATCNVRVAVHILPRPHYPACFKFYCKFTGILRLLISGLIPW